MRVILAYCFSIFLCYETWDLQKVTMFSIGAQTLDAHGVLPLLRPGNAL